MEGEDSSEEVQWWSDELSHWGAPMNFDGTLEIGHWFFVAEPIIVSSFDWDSMGRDGGLEWGIFPTVSQFSTHEVK